MVEYTTTILKFDSKGEKTRWTYIEVPADVAQKLKPGNKKSFRVKGKLDSYSISRTALLPMGEGGFIIPINAKFRKGIGKRHGAMLHVQLEEDKTQFKLDAELTACLNDEPEAKNFFSEMPKSHQNYFSSWIAGAKTEATKTKRIAQTINAMVRKQNFGEMLRAEKENR